jgi:hypothetical protein
MGNFMYMSIFVFKISPEVPHYVVFLLKNNITDFQNQR